MGRPPQVRTKLPFLRKCNRYLWSLDSRYFPFVKVLLKAHLVLRQFSKIEHKCKELKSEGPTASLIWKKRKLSKKRQFLRRVITIFNRDYDLHKITINRYTFAMKCTISKSFYGVRPLFKITY